MLKHLALVFFFAVSCLPAIGQKLPKPTLTPREPSPEHRQLINEGIKLHDQKLYDEAIKKYQLVLNANPDCTLAMYEMVMSLYTKGDVKKATELAVNGAKYRSQELPLFYMSIANSLDDVGKPKEAIGIYRDALKILEDDKEMAAHISNVRYNLAITYFRQKQYLEARNEAKKAVETDHTYPSPHYLLAEIFYGSKYKVPGFIAAARLISLETNTARTDRAALIINSILKPTAQDPKTGNINIFLDMNSPKDEGDYSMYDLFLGTLLTVKDEKDKDKPEEEIFADAVDSVVALVLEDKKLSSTFVGKQYVPFLGEMKRLGHTRALSYIVLYKSGNQKALKWLTENSQKTKDFLAWGKSYRPSEK